MNIFLVYLVINSPQNTGYNFGLGYISSILKENNHIVKYIVLKNRRDIFKLYKKMEEENPEIIGFSATTSQFYYLSNIAKRIKELSKTFIICGGIHPTLRPNCILEVPELDAIVLGEGEYPMAELANAMEKRRNYYNIKNFWFKKEGTVIRNLLRPLINNLDELPCPDKSSLDYQHVIDAAWGRNRFIFSRGCVFHCPYCSNKALSELYGEMYFRLCSPTKAIEEISLDESKFKFKMIVFDDDIINLDKNWFYEFFTLYKKRFKYKFICNIMPAIINVDMVKFLKEAGMVGAAIGVEHGNESFRKNILKREITNKQIVNTFSLFRKFGIYDNFVQVMVGLPYENKELFFDTVRLCRKLGIKLFNRISIFAPYPGTELGAICEANNWLPQKNIYYERHKAVISFPGFSKKEIQLCHDVFPLLTYFRFIPLFLLKLSFYCLFLWDNLLGHRIANRKQIMEILLWRKRQK